MRTYTFALVLTASTGKEDTKAKKLAETLVTEAGGKVTDAKVLGVRDLAYQINKQTQGWYGFLTIELPENKTKELITQAKLNEQVLRYLLIVKD